MSMVPKYLTGYNNTYASVEASLAQLQVEYIDLVMIHHRAADISDWPRTVSQMAAFPDDWAAEGSPSSSNGKSSWQAPSCAAADPSWLTCQDETWKALSQLRAAGTVLLRAPVLQVLECCCLLQCCRYCAAVVLLQVL